LVFLTGTLSLLKHNYLPPWGSLCVFPAPWPIKGNMRMHSPFFPSICHPFLETIIFDFCWLHFRFHLLQYATTVSFPFLALGF
jgi:hypothetical protein